MAREGGDVWGYPKSREVLAAMGLRPVEHYNGVRWSTIARWITHEPIFELCTETERRRGLAPHQFWWEQSLDLPPPKPRGGLEGVAHSRMRRIKLLADLDEWK